MSTFDLEKMVRTIDNLSTCLDIMLCCKDTEGGQEILKSCEQLDNLIMSFDDQMNILKEALMKEKNARQSVKQLYKKKFSWFFLFLNFFFSHFRNN